MSADSESSVEFKDTMDQVKSSTGSTGDDKGKVEEEGGLCETLMEFCWTGLYLVPVYLVGCLGFSITWVMLGLALWFCWREVRALRSEDLRIGYLLARSEERLVREHFKDEQLPPWVHFPDVERVEWLNKILAHAWPFFSQYMENFLRDTIEPVVRSTNEKLKTFTFAKIRFGDQPPRITGVKTYDKNVKRNQILMDLHISYKSDCEVVVEIPKFLVKGGVKDFQLHGMLRVVLEPLIGQMPIIGALTLFFIQRPRLHIDWTGITNLFQLPGLNGISEDMVMDNIAHYLVLPKRFTIPLVNNLELAPLRFPLPQGVVRIHLLGARDLKSKDNHLVIRGKSDPYAMLRVGNQVYKSKVVKSTLHPQWNEVFEAIVHEVPGQMLNISVFDQDPDEDDFLGRVLVDLNVVKVQRDVDQWLFLEESGSGEVHLRLQWLSLVPEPDILQKVLQPMKTTPENTRNDLSTAMLVVYVDGASNLPLSKKSNITVDPVARLTVSDRTVSSQVCYDTQNPAWEEAFTFFIKDPNSQELKIQIDDNEIQQPLGYTTVPLRDLLVVKNMFLQQSFALTQSGPNSIVNLKLALRILILEHPEVDASEMDSKTCDLTDMQSRDHAGIASGPSESHQKSQSVVQQSPSFRSTRATSGGHDLASTSNGNIARCQDREETLSTASGVSTRASTSDLHKRLWLEFPNVSLGQIEITVRHSAQRKSLVLVIHACRQFIARMSEHPNTYVRLYALPHKRRRKTKVVKKVPNPTFDETLEFSMSLEEAQACTIDVAVKASGGFLSRKLLGKVLIELKMLDLNRGTTCWYDLTMNGQGAKDY
uniref:extended synaptotagmin-2-like n=1 Tax=Myxine glutinosa TaxID=7769 RepID=UPI00358F0F6D